MRIGRKLVNKDGSWEKMTGRTDSGSLETNSQRRKTLLKGIPYNGGRLNDRASCRYLKDRFKGDMK